MNGRIGTEGRERKGETVTTRTIWALIKDKREQQDTRRRIKQREHDPRTTGHSTCTPTAGLARGDRPWHVPSSLRHPAPHRLNLNLNLNLPMCVPKFQSSVCTVHTHHRTHAGKDSPAHALHLHPTDCSLRRARNRLRRAPPHDCTTTWATPPGRSPPCVWLTWAGNSDTPSGTCSQRCSSDLETTIRGD